MTRETFTCMVLDSEETLYRVAMAMLKNEKDCEDAVQTAILTAFEKLGTLKNEAYFKTWLVRILINTCHKRLRDSARQAPLCASIPDNTLSAEAVEVRAAIENLPEKIRQAVVLYYVEQFSIKEIKQILHIPEGTVKSRLSKGRALLRQALG